MSVIAKIRTAIVKNVVLKFSYFKYKSLYGMKIGENVKISFGARLDLTNPKGVNIGDCTAITSGAAIVTHDFVRREWKDVHIGKNCFLSYGCVVLPGVTVGDHCIIAANSVVGRDVPSNCVVMGNPARIVERDIKTGPWGIRLDKGNSAVVA